jgi:hypothetical protein
MIWMILSSLLVLATFLTTFFTTGNIWTATNVTGIFCVFYLLFVLIRGIRSISSPRYKWSILAAGLAILLFVMLHWNVMYRMTNYQYRALHIIHKVIFHGIALEELKTLGLELFTSYTEQQGIAQHSLGETFQRNIPMSSPDSSIIKSDIESKITLYAVSISDTQVVMICQPSISIDGERAEFKNFNGQTGMTQARLIISKRGMVYEIQN